MKQNEGNSIRDSKSNNNIQYHEYVQMSKIKHENNHILTANLH